MSIVWWAFGDQGTESIPHNRSRWWRGLLEELSDFVVAGYKIFQFFEVFFIVTEKPVRESCGLSGGLLSDRL